MCLDDKTLRGTFPLGDSHGVHLLAAYILEQGVVLAQVQVNGAFDDPKQALWRLSCLDLRGGVLSWDDLFARPALSEQIGQAHWDCL